MPSQLTGLAALAAITLGLATAAASDHNAWQRDLPAQTIRGHRIYTAECAACHGANLQCQPRWWEPGPDGLLPAPPHDATGHTWQHSDRELTELVAHGTAAFAPPGYRSAMPAYATRLSPAAIQDVIAYIRSTWPPGQRAWQAAQNPGGPALADLPGDWVFPATCGYHLQTP